MTTKTADKKRRAPRGYTRGALQEFIICDSDGNNLPPIYIQPYISRTSGAVLGFDLTDLHEGRLERPDMATWRVAVTDALRARIKDSKPTRHIAVVAYASSRLPRSDRPSATAVSSLIIADPSSPRRGR